MQAPTVKVVIDKKGNAIVDMNDFHGVGCGELGDKLKSIGRTISETKKPEFYELNDNVNSLDIVVG